LTIPKRHFDRTKARFTSALKKDSSSLANSETQAPSKCVSKRLAVGTVTIDEGRQKVLVGVILGQLGDLNSKQAA
jgi:hypothetical protein